MDALGFDPYTRDPEYPDSEIRAVEASGESRDELCPSTPADTAETPSDANDNKYCWDYP